MNAISPFSRRHFLTSTALATLGSAVALPRLPALAADDTRMDPSFVRLRPEIEPLVRLLEDTPREQVLDAVAARIRSGTTYREVLSALLLAGVRNIRPRPVGFKFHAVLVVHAAHLASQQAPESDRWLPIFWALDAFKSSQARDVREGDWTMTALDESRVPDALAARRAFTDAMDHWDEPAADFAAAALARTIGAQEAFDRFCWFSARDYRDFGHKAIYVANSWRTLQTIGWQHAEPVLRSLAYALLDRGGTSGNPADGDEEADRPGRANRERRLEIRPGWQRGTRETGRTTDLMEPLRSGSWDDASQAVVKALNAGADPSTVWDAVFLYAGELLMQRPGIPSLHACTTANALHYAFQQAGIDETRRYLLLQAASFMPLFRKSAGVAPDAPHLNDLTPEAVPGDSPEILAAIFRDVSRDKAGAARKTLAWLEADGDPHAFMDVAQRFIYLKGTDSHDYKFSTAVLEDFSTIHPALRNRFLAVSVHWLKGSEEPDSPLVERTRQLMG